MFKYLKIDIILIAVLFLLVPIFVSADYGGQETSFFIDHSYDLQKRAQLTASLIRITPELYFYVDNTWWGSLGSIGQQEAKLKLQELGDEFSSKIYPTLTKTFGFEWKPGIDNDVHITVLLHPMSEGIGGYINTGDEYSRLQSPFSNQREMIYLNSDYLASSLNKSYLAHEFVHLITFNQKERDFGVIEEIWLNELRAEYAPTLLGYDDDFENSNLKKRLWLFLQFSNDSLTEWKKEQRDYGVVNLFAQYLVEQYGQEILVDSLHYEKTGIASLNKALEHNGFSEDFADVFTDWTIASILNDCSIAEKYCYQNPDLGNFKIVPFINFLPLKGETTLAITEETQDWAGNWYKFIGGREDLKIDFAGYPEKVFQVPYILQDKQGGKEVGFLEIDTSQRGRMLVENFGSNITSAIIIPTLQSKTTGFDGQEKSYPFFWSVATQEKEGEEEEETEETTQTEDIQLLMSKIEFLEKQLAVLKEQLREALGQGSTPAGESGTLNENLKYSSRGEQVELLQTWLAQDPEVYPEGLITGYFGPLTQSAVIRFQEKYSADTLAPWDLIKGTGFVGSTTRSKLNSLYGG